jgi:para-aminobenzoate synthetase component II
VRVLVVDNYDSFVYNLVQYLAQLGAECVVLRNDDPELSGPDALDGFGGVLVSPGPGVPERAGASVEVIGWCAGRSLPVLGVCLGHQAIGVAWGATVDRAPELRHGKTSLVYHSGAGVPETIPDVFEVTGRTDGGVVMAMRHRELPVEGVQFHPESVLTEGGHRMLANWLAQCGHPVPEHQVATLESAMRSLAEAAARP